MVDVANIHLPVLLDDCVNLMAPALEHENAIAVDCTLGLAGHSIAFLKAAPQARLIGIDRDSEALGLATERMEREGLADRFIPVHAAFDQLDQVLADQDIERVDAVFMDLGLSSLQIDETDRGFSYSHDAPLDMRMDVSQPLTAERILATYDAAELVRIFKEYGEESFSRQIARAIVARRDKEPFTTTAQLNRLVDEVVPQAHRPAGNPAKRVFQALRIEVNGELDKLASTLPQAANRLHIGGRLVVESYHSLEDKTVKSFMAQGLRVDVPAGLDGTSREIREKRLGIRRYDRQASRNIHSREVPSRPTNMKSQPTRDRLRCGCGRWKSAVRFRHDGGNALRKPRRA